MFSTPSPTGDRMQATKTNGSGGMHVNHNMQQSHVDYNDYHYDDDDDEPDMEDIESDEEYGMFHIQHTNMDTMRVEEIPVKEPSLNAMPKKSALKKKPGQGGSAPGTPSAQDANNRSLLTRQENNGSLKWV